MRKVSSWTLTSYHAYHILFRKDSSFEKDLGAMGKVVVDNEMIRIHLLQSLDAITYLVSH